MTPERSPCPFLNTLANHGFLPRDGINITRDATNNAFDVVFNVDPAITDGIFTAALAGYTSAAPNTLNFVDLNQHGSESNLDMFQYHLWNLCVREPAETEDTI